MTDNPQPPVQLIEHLNRHDCVLFVGDALDGEGSPSARLASALVDACGAHSACPIPACQSGTGCTKPHDCAVPLTRAAQLYEKRTRRHSLVDFVLQHVDNDRPPGPIHRALAALPVRVIVTTTYDDRLEAALRLENRPFFSVVRDEDIPFDDPRRVQLIRLHGTISQPDSLVLTENDAADLFGRLPTVTRILQAHFASKTLLFVGYHLGDPHFLALHRQVTGPIARYQRLAYAVQWPPDLLAADRWQGEIAVLNAEPLPFLIQLQRPIRLQTVKAKRAALPPEPYKFLDYYERIDAPIFFGRDLETDLLLSTILAHKLTVFYGRSGTGKTSLLLARVAPALEAEDYQVAYTRMLGDPASEVKAALLRGTGRGLKQVEQLSHLDRGHRLIDVLVEALPPAGRLVVILDQFEEFFLRQGEAVRRAFAQELADCLAREDLDLRFVLSQRDDYLGALDQLTAFLPQDVFAHRFRLENLTRDKAILAILKPAEAFGLPVEDALCERLTTDLEDQGLEPANLQIVLYRLYRDAVEQGLWSEARKQGSGLTLARYKALGGTKEILAGYLDEVLEELPDPIQQQAAKAVLKSMVTAERTKAAVSGREIAMGDLVARVGLEEAELDALLAHLRQKRVVRKFGDEAAKDGRAEGGRYELAHEVMVDKVWAWVSDEEVRTLAVRDMLHRAMGDYGEFGHLLGPEKLELVHACCETLALAPSELEFLYRSALAAGQEGATSEVVLYWFERAREGGVAVDGMTLEALRSDSFRTRAVAVVTLAQLGERFVAPITARLADDYPQVRVAAIHALERLQPSGEWRKHLKYECYVPAGEFVMGEGADAHKIYLDAFYLGKYPVTNTDYKRYMDAIGRPTKAPGRKGEHPVVEVNWFDARNYAVWAGMRLPTEAEWEKAASWLQGQKRKRRYPWGDQFDRRRCNGKEARVRNTTPVGRYYRNHQTTPVSTNLLSAETVTIVDPRHPLFGRTLSLVAITNNRYAGRSCVVWLQDNVERMVPLAATDHAEEPFTIYPIPISLASVRQLVGAYEHIMSQSREGKDGNTHPSTPDDTVDHEDSLLDSSTAHAARGGVGPADADAAASGLADHRPSVSPNDGAPSERRGGPR